VSDDPGRPPASDPTDAETVDGADPDYRFTFANERTFLSWIRTSLALVAAGIAVVQLLPEGEPDAESYIVGVPLIALGTVLPLLSLRRWGENERAMRSGKPLPRSRLREVLAWWITATTLLAVIVVVARDAG
jgi:putative membrane protein